MNIVYGAVPVIDEKSKDFTEVLVCGNCPTDELRNIRVISVTRPTFQGSLDEMRTTYQLYNSGKSVLSVELRAQLFAGAGDTKEFLNDADILAPQQAKLTYLDHHEFQKKRLVVIVKEIGYFAKSSVSGK